MTVLSLPGQPEALLAVKSNRAVADLTDYSDGAEHRQDDQRRQHVRGRQGPGGSLRPADGRHRRAHQEHPARRHRAEGAAGADRRRHVRARSSPRGTSIPVESATVNEGPAVRQRATRPPCSRAVTVVGPSGRRTGSVLRRPGRACPPRPAAARGDQGDPDPPLGTLDQRGHRHLPRGRAGLLVHQEPQRRLADGLGLHVQAADAARPAAHHRADLHLDGHRGRRRRHARRHAALGQPGAVGYRLGLHLVLPRHAGLRPDHPLGQPRRVLPAASTPACRSPASCSGRWTAARW